MNPLMRWAATGIAAAAIGSAAGHAPVLIGDEIVLFDEAQHETDATVYMTGNRWGGCFCRFLDVQGHAQMDNITGGPAQLAVFSPKHGLLFKPDVPWKLDPWERKAFTVPKIAELPVAIWNLPGGSKNAEGDFTRAADMFAAMQTGIKLIQPGPAGEVNEVIKPGDACTEMFLQLELRHKFDPAAVNVYYAAEDPTTKTDPAGLSCPDGRVNFVFSNANDTVLAHELGHALLHDNNHWAATAVDQHNFMLPGQQGMRNHITAGQSIFMNRESGSVLNTLRNDAGLQCAVQCPNVALDFNAPDCQIPVTPKAPPSSIETTLNAWFDCIECRAGELETLVRRLEGPIPLLVEPLKNFKPAGEIPFDRDFALARNNLARQQRRAAIALSLMAQRPSGDPAMNELEQAAQNARSGRYYSDVADVVRRAAATAAAYRNR